MSAGTVKSTNYGVIMMLHITLQDGKELELTTHRPLNVLNGEGDSWGNGSIDWLPDGLFLHEIVEQAGETRKIVAALRDGLYITMDTFVNQDCTLRFIAADEPIGQSMMTNTVKLLVSYAMYQLHPEYECLQSDTPLLYGYVSPDDLLFSNEELTQLNEQLQIYLNNPPIIKTYLMPYIKVVKQLANQGQISQAKYLLAQDSYYPLRVHEIDSYIQLADDKPLIPLQYIPQIEIVAQELLTVIESSILQLSAKM